MDDDVFDITLPVLRSAVGYDDYIPAALDAFLEGRSWPDYLDGLALASRAKRNVFFRRELVANLRNCMWLVRNHRTVAVATVVDGVRRYAAAERLLELAGVRPVMLALLCDFFLCDCRCKGSCDSMDFDLVDVELMPKMCDRVSLRVRQIANAGICSEKLIIERLLDGRAAPFTGALSARGGARVVDAEAEYRRASSAARFAQECARILQALRGGGGTRQPPSSYLALPGRTITVKTG